MMTRKLQPRLLMCVYNEILLSFNLYQFICLWLVGLVGKCSLIVVQWGTYGPVVLFKNKVNAKTNQISHHSTNLFSS